MQRKRESNGNDIVAPDTIKLIQFNGVRNKFKHTLTSSTVVADPPSFTTLIARAKTKNSKCFNGKSVRRLSNSNS